MREELLKESAEEALKNGPHRFIRPDDKIFYMDGFKDGYNLGLKAKINKTTISDAPALSEADEDYKISIAKEAWDAVNTCTPCHPESFVQGYIAGAEPREKRIADLEKGNAELKEALKGKRCNCMTYLNFKDLEDELDRADKLLQRVIEWSEWQGSGCPRFNDIKDDIKAFLEEVHHD